jgi:xylan 1,4-beta-xylosidase
MNQESHHGFSRAECQFEGTRSLFTASNITTPLLNAYRMLARLPDRRLRVDSDQGRGLTQLGDAAEQAEVDGLAATNGSDRVVAVVWHHCDDQYRQGAAQVTVTVRHLPFAGRPVRLRHYRVDHAHSNSHSAWVAAGRPQDPSAGQLAAIRAHEGLSLCAPEQVIERAPDHISLSFELPLPGMSLLEFLVC